MPDPLKNLILDAWYKVFVYLGGFVFVLSLFVDTKVLSNAHVQLLSGGFFLIGIGEWINRKENVSIVPPNIYLGGRALKITEKVWSPVIAGVIFDLFGLISVIIFILALCNVIKV